MSMSRNSRIAPLLPVLLAVSLLAGITPLRAQTEAIEPETGDGPRKVLMYIGCAVAVFAATSVPGLLIALVGCGKMVIDESPKG